MQLFRVLGHRWVAETVAVDTTTGLPRMIDPVVFEVTRQSIITFGRSVYVRMQKNYGVVALTFRSGVSAGMDEATQQEVEDAITDLENEESTEEIIIADE